MKKILLYLSIIVLLSLYNIADAGYYRVGNPGFSSTSGTTGCGAGQTATKTSTVYNPSISTGSMPTSGAFYCVVNDTTAPVAWVISYTPSGWTSGNVTVTSSCTDGQSGCVQASYSTVRSGNGAGSITITDNVGNSRAVAYNVTTIDKTSPTGTVSYSPSGWSNGNVTVTVACSDSASGCAQATYSTVRTANGAGSITIADNSGNTRAIAYNVTNIDKTSPTGTVSYSPSGSTNGNVTVTISCSDVGVGCAQATYSTVRTANGAGSITIADNAGNTRAVAYNVTNIDKTSPTGTVSYSPSGWTNGNVTVTVACSDSASGCAQATYSTVRSANGAGSITIADNAGNTRAVAYNVTNIDQTPPTGTVSYSPSGWTNGNVTVTISCSDVGVGCAQATYSTVITTNGAGTITIADNAGNTSDIVYNVTNIDKTVPSGVISSTSSPFPHIRGGWSGNNIPKFTISNDGQGPSPVTRDYCVDTNNTCTPTIDYTGEVTLGSLAEGIHYIRSSVTDTGGTGTDSFQLKIDTTKPTAGDLSIISGTPLSGAKILAGSLEFGVRADINGGSPIVRIDGYFEDADSSTNGYKSISVSSADLNPGNAAELSITGDITKVDNDRHVDGYRQYAFKITRIEDEAGNTVSDSLNGATLPKYLYYVFADSDNVTKKEVILNELDDNNVADGSISQLTILLEDMHGNGIIQATDINRKIDITFNVNNNLKLNQYAIVPSDGVFLDNSNGLSPVANGKLPTGPTTFSNEISTDGIYNYNFQIYTPTYTPGAINGQGYANGDMTINTIEYTIRQDDITPASQTQFIDLTELGTRPSSIEFDFTAMFETQFTGDLDVLESNGVPIQAGVTHTAEVTTTRNSAVGITGGQIYFEFGQTSELLNIAHPSYDLYYNETANIAEGHQTSPLNSITDLQSLGILPNTGNIGPILFPVRIDQTALVDPSLATYLSTHIYYSIGGVGPIVYDGDVINKIRYADGTASTNNTNQLGLKVYGKIQSKTQMDLTTGQTGTDLYQLGNNPKSGLKEFINKNTAVITRNISGAISGSITDLTGNKWVNTSGTKLKNDTILYFDLTPGTNLEIGNGTDLVAGGVKTIVVKGGNIYIKNNITYNDDSSDILGVIALKENNIGGNIYVDPSVTHIVGTYYADKAMISYNGSEINWDGSIALENQLYLYGTLFSENTIGGSLIPQCPYYVSITCDINESRKYDLNFMRRYFLDPDGNPYNGGSAYAGSPSNAHPMVIEYNPNIQITPPPLFSDGYLQ